MANDKKNLKEMVPLFDIAPRDFRLKPLTYKERTYIVENCYFKMGEPDLSDDECVWYRETIDLIEADLKRYH